MHPAARWRLREWLSLGCALVGVVWWSYWCFYEAVFARGAACVLVPVLVLVVLLVVVLLLPLPLLLLVVVTMVVLLLLM